MDNNKLLNNEELEKVSGGKYIVTDKGYNLYQIAWIVADNAIKSNGKYPAEVEKIRANWPEIHNELIEAGLENVTVQQFIDELDKAWCKNVLKFWPPV
jgi:hypothetical protein